MKTPNHEESQPFDGKKRNGTEKKESGDENQSTEKIYKIRGYVIKCVQK